MSPDPSQQQSHHSSLHYHRCWWAFCRHSFYSTVELQEHINLEHVQNARPERLRDVPAHKFAEDDYWDSLDISSPPHMLAVPRLLQRVSDQAVAGDRTVDFLYNFTGGLTIPFSYSSGPYTLVSSIATCFYPSYIITRVYPSPNAKYSRSCRANTRSSEPQHIGKGLLQVPCIRQCSTHSLKT